LFVVLNKKVALKPGVIIRWLGVGKVVVDEEKNCFVLADGRQVNGFDALKSIKEDHPKTKVMFLSMNEDKTILYKALAFQADGYQFKNITRRCFTVNLWFSTYHFGYY
jgi:DNA-binding NarL/FixJ family response regulator